MREIELLKHSTQEMIRRLEESMRPIDYFTESEKFLYRTIRRDLPKSKSLKEVAILERNLDILLEKAISRYIKEKETV